jgi:uncharacterized protein (TIGR03437 family)
MAQPVVESALHSAAFTLPGMPNYGIPQGSIFTAFGQNMGAPGINQVSAFPLLAEFDGISMQVTVGQTTVDCIPISRAGVPAGTPATQVSGILPSNTPVGDGTLTLTYNGQTSAPIPIRVVAHSFGVYAINSAGSGPAVVTDVNFQVSLITNSLQAGQPVILWGTGLGAVAGDEAAGALPGDLPLDVKVFVGGKEAKMIYRGRSGCCAGLDQLVFEIPEGVEGCYVSLVVVVEGVVSNFTTVSIASNGGACSDPNVLSAQDLEKAASQGFLRLGTISLNRTGLSFESPLGSFDINTDTGSGGFFSYNFGQLIRFQGAAGLTTVGSCVVYQFKGTDAEIFDPVTGIGLDAGPVLNLNGPMGAKQLNKQGPGSYGGQIGGGAGPFGGGQPDYLEPGDYRVDNGAGGADVGPFQAMLTLPQPLNWTNKGAINNVQRSQNLTITWTGGDPNGYARIMGFSAIQQPQESGAIFICREPVSAGQFTVPSAVLSALPPSTVVEGIPTGFLMVGGSTKPVQFTPQGLDVGLFVADSLTGKNVGYQ